MASHYGSGYWIGSYANNRVLPYYEDHIPIASNTASIKVNNIGNAYIPINDTEKAQLLEYKRALETLIEDSILNRSLCKCRGKSRNEFIMDCPAYEHQDDWYNHCHKCILKDLMSKAQRKK